MSQREKAVAPDDKIQIGKNRCSTVNVHRFTHQTPTVDGKVFLTCLLMTDEAEEVLIEGNGREEKSDYSKCGRSPRGGFCSWAAQVAHTQHDVGMEDIKTGP